MGKIIIIRPGEEATTSRVNGALRLGDLHRAIGTDNLDARGLGTIPPRGTRVHMWIDDLGLSNPAALPNRRMPAPAGYPIFGTIVLCAVHGEDDTGFAEDEVKILLSDIEARWEKLAPTTPKPEGTFSVRTF